MWKDKLEYMEMLMNNNERYELLYQTYQKEMRYVLSEMVMDEREFTSMASKQLENLHLIEIEIDNQYGFLYYWEERNGHIIIPVYGYYAKSEKIMTHLFKKLANEVVQNITVEFSIHLYSHDHICLNALHMMQFGNIAETCIKEISKKPIEKLSTICIQELNKEEIKNRWIDVWGAVSQIIHHLTLSPIFYDGKEFTEEAYKEFFMNHSTHVIAASIDDKIIGIIEWNEEKNSMISQCCCSVNVGEAFVYPEFRGTGLSHQLLQYAENQAYNRDAKYMWVEHGTANPEACGFWNKFFDTYQYELIRVIERN